MLSMVPGGDQSKCVIDAKYLYLTLDQLGERCLRFMMD